MFRQLKLAFTSATFVLLCFGMAQADTVTISGDTFLAPDGTFRRSQGEAEPPGTGLSTIGTNVAFDSTRFSVSQSGAYTFVLTSLEPFFYDPFLALYSNSFNPANALTNLLIDNDDLAPGNFSQSGFTFSLTAGVNYFAVATGFSNFDSGAFTLVISGPGTITVGGTAPPGAIPEPTTMLLLGTGLAGIAANRRSRRAGGKTDAA